MKDRVLRFIRNQSGSIAAEYGLIAVGLSVSIIFIVIQLVSRP